MVIEANIYPAIDKTFKASVSGNDDTHWITIRTGSGAVNIFGKSQHIDALKMMADIFNDAFQPKAEALPEPQEPPKFEDSDIPW